MTGECGHIVEPLNRVPDAIEQIEIVDYPLIAGAVIPVTLRTTNRLDRVLFYPKVCETCAVLRVANGLEAA